MMLPKLPPEADRISIPDDVLDDASHRIGKFILTWAVVETATAIWATTFRNEGGKFPSSLSDQIKAIRRHLRSYPENAEKAEIMLIEVDRLAEVRYILTHGSVTHYASEPPGWIFFRRIKRGSKSVAREQIDALTIPQIAEATVRAMKVADQMIVAAMHIWVNDT